MRLTQSHVFIFFSLVMPLLTGCSLGMLLFYRDSTTTTVYRNSSSKKNYFIIKATTIYRCGCTELYIENYKDKKKDCYYFYNDNSARKTVYRHNKQTNQKDTLRLLATPYDNYTTAFDSLDIEVFKRIDSISIKKTKGIVYGIKRTQYKGFIQDPYYNH
jgi:hypothetical protein